MVPSPLVGDTLHFRYPDSPTFRHAVYDDFPHGRRVRAAEAYVDLHGAIWVEEVREAYLRTTRRPRGSSTRVLFVAVRFTAVNGTVLWSNYSKGDPECVY